MKERLENIKARYEEISALLMQSDIMSDFKKVSKLSKEQSDLKAIVLKYEEYEQAENALNEAKTVKGKPTMIIANTIKGKGVSYMENVANWHGVAPNEEQCQIALNDLGGEE